MGSSDTAVQRFSFGSGPGDATKDIDIFCRTEGAIAALQVLRYRHSGEPRLHSHKGLDGFWFVLSGRVRFYTADDVVIADLGPREGILIPRGYPYWFESVSDEVSEVLQVEVSDKPLRTMNDVRAGRVSHQRPSETEKVN
jgi:mannose-6-phosphate isomerase-like protein (cupin superfamily)